MTLAAKLELSSALKALETGLFDLADFLRACLNASLTLNDDLLKLPDTQGLDPDALCALLARAFGESFLGLSAPEREELARVARRDLMAIATDAAVMDLESGFISLPNLFVSLPLARWKDHLPDPSLPPKLKMAPAVLAAVRSKAAGPEQLAAMVLQVLERPLRGKFFMDEALQEHLHTCLGARWLGERPLPSASLVRAIGRQRVGLLVSSGALTAAAEVASAEADDNHVPEMALKKALFEEAKQAEKDPLSLAASQVCAAFGLAGALSTRVRQLLEQGGLGQGKDVLQNLEPLTTFLVNQSSHDKTLAAARKSRALLGHQIQRRLVEEGPFEIRLILKSQAPMLTRSEFQVTFTRDYQLKDGSPNRQLFLRKLTDSLFPGQGALAHKLLENPRILNSKTGQLTGFAELFDQLKPGLPLGHTSRTSTNELLLEQLKRQKVLELATVQVRERVASSGLELSLSQLPLEDKIVDLDGTNLGSFGAATDIAQVMSAWSLLPDKHFDAATTLQTLYEKGRTEPLAEALAHTVLNEDAPGAPPGETRMLVLMRVLLEQVLNAAQATRLGDIALSRDCLLALVEGLGDEPLEKAVAGLMGARGEAPLAALDPDRALLSGFVSATMEQARLTSPEATRRMVTRWLKSVAVASETLVELSRKGKGPLMFSQESLCAALGALDAPALKEFFPPQPPPWLLVYLTRLFKPLSSLGENDTTSLEHFARVIKTLGYCPKEISAERLHRMIRRFRPELLG